MSSSSFGLISAAQPTTITPVPKATLDLHLRGEQTLVSLVLGGTFRASTTLVFETSNDGVTWSALALAVSGASPVFSVVGGVPLILSGVAAALSTVRVRCTTYTSGDLISVALTGKEGTISQPAVAVATSSGPGLVRQTVFNVLDYGAKADKVTDDSAAIQAAINAAQANGGGTVLLPAVGPCAIGTRLNITTNNVRLEGAGTGAGLYALNGLNDDLVRIAAASGQLTGIALRNLYIDGNQNGQNAGSGIHLQSVYNMRMEQVWVIHAHDFGLWLDQTPGQGFSAYGLYTDCSFTDGYGTGAVGVRGGSGSEMNCFIGCNFDWHSGNQGKGVWLSSGLNCFIRCQFDANGYNLFIDANTKNDFIACIFDRAFYREVWLTGGTKDNHFISCKFGYFTGNLNLAGALSGTVTSIPLKTPLTQDIPTWGVPIYVDYGNGSEDHFQVTNAGCAAGATSIPVNSRVASFSHADNAAVVLRYRGFDAEGGAGYNYFDVCTFQNAQNLTNNFNWAQVYGEDAGCKSMHFLCEYGGGGTTFLASSKIIQTSLSPVGHQTSPGMPASGTPLVNPFPYDCTVYISGGTVTVIAVGGSASGLISGTFRVAAGQSLTLTYTVAPTTFNWFAD